MASGPPDISIWGLTKTYVRMYPGITFWLIVLTLVYPAASLLFPIMFGIFADAVARKRGDAAIRALIWILAIVVTVYVAYTVDLYVSQIFSITMMNLIHLQLVYYIFETRSVGVGDSVPTSELLVFVHLFAELMSERMNIFRNNVAPGVIALAAASVYLLFIDRVLFAAAAANTVAIVSALVYTSTVPKEAPATAISADMAILSRIGDILDNFSLIISSDSVESEVAAFRVLGEEARRLRSRSVLLSMRLSCLVIAITCLTSLVYFYRLYVRYLNRGDLNALEDGRLKRVVTLTALLFEVVKNMRSLVYYLYDMCYTTSALDRSQAVMDSYPSAGREFAHPLLAASGSVAYAAARASGSPAFGALEAARAPLVRMRDVSFRYAKGGGLHGVNFEVCAGERVALVGENGSGKTTLLRLLMRYEAPSAGEIAYLGFEDDIDVRRRIAYIGQTSLLLDRTILENVAYAVRGATALTAADRAGVEEVIARVGFAHLVEAMGGLDRVVGPHGGYLSGGQRQVVQFLRALMQPAVALYVFDEMTSAVDEAHAHTIRECIERHVPRSCAVVFTAHDPVFVKLFATRVVKMSGGCIAA